MTMSMVRSGHIAHAMALINENFFLAWGDLGTNYPDPWSQVIAPPVATSALHTETRTKGAPGTSDTLSKTGVIKLVSIKDSANVTYTAGVDFFLDENKVNWSLGGAEPAQGLGYTAIYRYYTEDVSSLIHELGRRKVGEKAYVVEDSVNGDIVANGKKWRRVTGPTENIFLSFRFESTEAVDTSIYQVAIFVGTETDPDLPSGQFYFTPNQVENPGSAYMLENLEPFPRNAGKREIFEFVITF